MFEFFPQAGASSTLNKFLLLLLKNVLCLNSVSTLIINDSILQTVSSARLLPVQVVAYVALLSK